MNHGEVIRTVWDDTHIRVERDLSQESTHRPFVAYPAFTR